MGFAIEKEKLSKRLDKCPWKSIFAKDTNETKHIFFNPEIICYFLASEVLFEGTFKMANL